jgi:iron complex outermembrane receptor protein
MLEFIASPWPWAALLATAAQAQTAPAAAPPAAEPERPASAEPAGSPASAPDATLEPVVVTGSRGEVRALAAPYAIAVVGADALRAGGPRVNLSESLARVPGLTVNNRNNYAQDLQISSRGFGSRASFGVRGVRLYSDGIPATMPDGSGQVSHFDLAGAERVEVLRGPFSALYGNASGGVIALYSAPAQQQLRWGLDAGSDHMRQLRGHLQLPLENGREVQATVSRFRTEGPRPHSFARRDLVNVRWAATGGRDRLVLVGNAIDQPAQDPLGLSRAQFDADPRQTTAQAFDFNTRKLTRQQQLGATWTHRADSTVLRETTVTSWMGQREVTQWQAIPSAPQTASANHAGGVIDFTRLYGGLDARASWQFAPGVRLVTGAALEQQRDARRGYENFIGSTLGVTGALRRDEVNRARTADVYAQGEVALSPTVTAHLGLRHGRVSLASRDAYLANGDDSGRVAFTSHMPVASLQWQPRPDLNLYVSAGRGFESPTLNEAAYRTDGLSGFNTALRGQTSGQVELGAKWRDEAARTAVEFAVFRAETENEIAVRSNQGGRSSFANVGRTRRQGAEVALRWQPAPAWHTTWAWTWLDATYRDGFLACTATPCPAPTTPVPAGNRIAGTTPRGLFAELAWRPRPERELALEWRAQGRVAVNDLNSDFAAGYGVLAARAQVALSSKPGRVGTVTLLGRIDNLLDKTHVGSVIVNEGNGRFFEPGPPRSVFLGLELKL